MSNFKDLGSRFVKYMENNELGVNKMAKKLDFSGSQISNIRNGKVFGTDKLFKILNNYTDLDANWLFRGEELNKLNSQNNQTEELIVVLKENIELRKEIDRLKTLLNDVGVNEKDVKRSVG